MSARLLSRWFGRIPYIEGLDLQESLVQEKLKGNKQEHLLLLEHDPVFTMGRSRDESSLGEETALPFPIHRTNRGGQATYHGPGQLVGYPILDLNERGRDLHRYLRFLEEVIIITMAAYSVSGSRRDGMTGVWVENRKIASIGVGVRRWISMHGFALNVARDLPGFNAITPCGIAGVAMTSLSAECGRDLETREVADLGAEVFLRELENLPGGRF
jgi:lipoyl(octanoyl) transferase